MTKISLLVASMFCVTALASHAEPVEAQDQADNDRKRRKPPRQAMEACENASNGDTCSFEGREGESVSGTCHRPPGDTSKPLACRPNDAPEPPRRSST